jgi:DNA invertase Pin-like site-specific DNA recombinase
VVNAKRVVGYIRVSTEKQLDSGLSLEMQRKRLEAYALALDLDLVAIIEDPGASAKTLDRPGLRAALAMLTAGRADALLVVKLDRLTRSVRDLGELVERYFATRYSLLSMSDAIDTRTAAGRLVLNILTSVAQWEREATGERTRDAMAHMKAKGEFTGGNSAPYGYAVENGKLVPVESEQEAIRVAKDLQNAGLSRREIAKILDQKGIRSRSGKVFAATQIGRMLAVNIGST